MRLAFLSGQHHQWRLAGPGSCAAHCPDGGADRLHLTINVGLRNPPRESSPMW